MKDIKGGTALILCASPEWDSGLAAEQAKKADLVICADGGYLRAEAAGIRFESHRKTAKHLICR